MMPRRDRLIDLPHKVELVGPGGNAIAGVLYALQQAELRMCVHAVGVPKGIVGVDENDWRVVLDTFIVLVHRIRAALFQAFLGAAASLWLTTIVVETGIARRAPVQTTRSASIQAASSAAWWMEA